MTWISHGCTCIPHSELPSHLPLHPIPLGCPSALALSVLFHTLNLDWSSVSHMLIYMFQCYSLRSSHPCLLPQSPKVCSLYLCLFCCLRYRVIITIFLNSLYKGNIFKMEFNCHIQFSHSVVSDCLRPHRLQHARLRCPSPTHFDVKNDPVEAN